MSKYSSLFVSGNKAGKKNRTISAPLADTQWLTLRAGNIIRRKGRRGGRGGKGGRGEGDEVRGKERRKKKQ